MPMLNIYVADDMLHFLREQAEQRGRKVEDLAEAAVENSAYEAGFKSAATAEFWDFTMSIGR